MATASSNSCSLSQRRCSTHIRRKRAMCAGGPPKPISPMRPHSRAIVARATLLEGCSVMAYSSRPLTVAGAAPYPEMLEADALAA